MRVRLLLLLCAWVCIATPGCARERRGATESEDTEPGGSAAVVVRTNRFVEIAIDGSTNDWVCAEPLWGEAGQPLDDPGFSIDVKEVFVTNDDSRLYIFLRCLPDVDERFKEHPLPGEFCDLYFDIDNDRYTGTTDTELDIFGYRNGYELRVAVDLLVESAPDGKKRPRVGCQLFNLDRPAVMRALEALAADPGPARVVMRQVVRRVLLWRRVGGCAEGESDGDIKITHGPCGVEMSIPLGLFGIRPGQGICILLGESCHNFEPDGYSVRYYAVR